MKSRILTILFLLITIAINAGNIEVPRLSPLPVRVMDERIALSGKWLFNPDPEPEFWKKESVRKWKNIEVPGEWVMQGFEVEKGKAAGYCRTFAIPAAWQGKRVKLRCIGVYCDAQVYING